MTSPIQDATRVALLARLRDVVGVNGVIDDPGQRAAHEVDWFGTTLGQAIAVVMPASTAEVAAVVSLCREQGLAVVPQGGRTGLVCGGMPLGVGREVIVSLQRMKRILSLDAESYMMTVEAGVVLQDIQQAAAAADRYFPISLGAQGSCTIGGNLATNAGGATVLHYGSMRGMVLGLEVVLPDGRIWDGLRSLSKDNTGYDLKSLFVGAEGTLGIITRAVIRLYPRPREVVTAWFAVPNPAAALEVLAGARLASDDRVTSCELVHERGLEIVLRHIPGTRRPLEGRHTWQVLMEWSSTLPADTGGGSAIRTQMEEYLSACIENGIVEDAMLAQNDSQAKGLWTLREAQGEGGRKDGPFCTFDISIPVHRIPEFIVACDAASEQAVPGIRSRPMGHVGDGNLHYTFSAPESVTDKAAFAPSVARLDRIVHDLATEFGGSISAEHGIGASKLKELEHYRSVTELDLMRAIKSALDPAGIMNPGKVVRATPSAS